MNEPDILIQNQFKNLTLSNQRAISNSNWKEKIKVIATENHLTAEQAAALETETLLLLYHFQSAENFFDNLARELKINNDQTQKIVNGIEDTIIVPVDEEIEKNETSLDLNLSNETQTDEWKRPQLASLPNYSDYEAGKDPYREPLG